ncbi:MAG: CinA family protein, partial [Pikeienuella sp.]
MPTAKDVLNAMIAKGCTLVTVESCTGGMIAASLTDIAGSSAVVERGYVTYSNAAKAESVGVAPTLIEEYGAVSEPVARAMA